MRRAVINGFSDRALKEQSSVIASHTDLLLTRLRSEVGKSREGKVDMAKYYGYAVLDIIADLIFGESFYGLAGSWASFLAQNSAWSGTG